MLTRFLAIALLLSVPAFAADDDPATLSAWRAARLARLVTPDGWLALIGRHPLAVGENSVGTAADNSIRLAAGPPYLASVTVGADRKIMLAPAPSAIMDADGVRVQSPIELVFQGENPTHVKFGSANFYVMERGDKLYLRVRDTEAPTLKNFAGLDYFPADPTWRIEATWVPFDPIHQVPFTNVLGVTQPAPVPGKAVFTYDGHQVELLPIDEGGDELFFVLTDLTAGDETYEASRFLYAARPKDGKIVLDFNQMQNPPCAFTTFATCPLPPKENHLPFRVTAGEKKYRGSH